MYGGHDYRRVRFGVAIRRCIEVIAQDAGVMSRMEGAARVLPIQSLPQCQTPRGMFHAEPPVGHHDMCQVQEYASRVQSIK